MQEPLMYLRARMAVGTRIDVGLANKEVRALAIDPSNPNILYAGTFGVFKSTDGGGHCINVGLPTRGFVPWPSTLQIQTSSMQEPLVPVCLRARMAVLIGPL